MQSHTLQRYHERLLDERNTLLSQRDQALATIQEAIHPPGENQVLPSEGIDVEMSLDEGAVSRLEQIDAALEMIKNGTFGTCSQCGCRIPDDRLQEIPSASCCVSCEESHDRS